jgi:GntR family transcriptional regulator
MGMRVLVVDTRSPLPVYQQIIEQVRLQVQEATLAPGTPLPSVRQLAADLDVNPNTVAKAYLLLERDGVIQTVRRRGTFVAEQAAERLRAQQDRRLDEVTDKIIRQAEGLGLTRDELLLAVQRRLQAQPADGRNRGGANP